MTKARIDKIIKTVKENRFLLFIAAIISLILAYLLISIFGMLFTILASAFFVSMYHAKDKTHYITLLKILGVITLVGGAILIIILMNHEWPGN